MTSSIAAFLGDRSLPVSEKEIRTVAWLGSRPGQGISEIEELIRGTDDPAVASFAANYLALLPDHPCEKRQLVEFVLDRKRHLMIAIANLVKDMPADVVDRLIAEYLREPSSSDLYSLVFEVALYFPARLRREVDRIPHGRIRGALLAGGPATWVGERVERYRRDHDPAHLRSLSRFRTDEALTAMLALQREVPEDQREFLDACIESSGVFPDTREASVYFRAFRGFVVTRGRSPHHMGPGFDFAVPRCAICDTPAARVLTVRAGSEAFELTAGIDPSFFWYECAHPPGFVYAHVTEAGVEGIMTPMTDRPVDSGLVPDAPALLLQEHSNQSGRALEAIPGFANHQVGGYPPWIRIERFPRCPYCGRGMRFLASIDSGMTPFGRMGFAGILYGFWCAPCAVSATYAQRE